MGRASRRKKQKSEQAPRGPEPVVTVLDEIPIFTVQAGLAGAHGTVRPDNETRADS